MQQTLNEEKQADALLSKITNTGNVEAKKVA